MMAMTGISTTGEKPMKSEQRRSLVRRRPDHLKVSEATLFISKMAGKSIAAINIRLLQLWN